MVYGVVVHLTSGRCLADLLELRNEYRSKNRGELPVVLLSESDYEVLASEYPVRNYGNKVHGMEVVVIRPWGEISTPCELSPIATMLLEMDGGGDEIPVVMDIPTKAATVAVKRKAGRPRRK